MSCSAMRWAIAQKDLTNGAWRVLVTMASLSKEGRDGYSLRIGQHDLAGRIDVPISSIKRQLKELREKRLVSIVRIDRQDGGRDINLYVFGER